MNLHETAMGQRFFNVQLPALINTLKDIAAALSRPAPSAISFPADQHFLTSLYYGEYEADVFKPDKRLSPFNQAVQQKEKALLPLLSNEASIAFEQYQAAVQCRNSAVLEQAYASGYRTAVQMFAAGLGPQPTVQNMRRIAMDENRLPELPQETFRPMIAQSVQLEQFLGEELTFCFQDLDGVHTFTTCYGDIYKTVNALRDYVRLLESVCDQWELTGFHRATYEYHAEKLRKIADKLQAGIGYDYDKAVEGCKKKRARKSHSNDVGEDALLLTVRAAGKSADNEKEAAPYEEDTPWEPELE